jgi:hypothetical protein
VTGGPYIHPDQTPEERTAAAQEMNRRRWQDVPQEERRRIARAAGILGGRPREGDRCACGAMTLARAQARADRRGTGLGHAPGCPFYRRAPRPGKRRAKRK